MTMLESGIGSVRLAPFERDGEAFWFCSASSIGWSDHGVPLVIPDTVFQEVFAEIRETGCVLARIRGRVKFIYRSSDEGKSISNYIRQKVYDTHHGIPRLYLHVDDIEREHRKEDESFHLNLI